MQAISLNWMVAALSRHVRFLGVLNLPSFIDSETFRTWRSDASQWTPIAIDIARSHGLPHAAPHVFQTGTNLVLALDDSLILKIFPPMFRRQFASERASLAQLEGRLAVAIPAIVRQGERDGWPYLVMMRLEGVLGSQAWPSMPEDQKEDVLTQIGEAIAQVQRAPLGELAHVEPRWEAFILGQMAACRARHERLGLPEKYLVGLDRFVREAPTLIPMNTPPVILTGEYIPENFLLTESSRGWRLSGLFDFGDVLTGWGEYDLLGPSAFMTAGMPRRVRNLLKGFGYTKADMNSEMTGRLMTLLLLHRASDPIRHICISGWQEKTDSLDAVERLLWPVV